MSNLSLLPTAAARLIVVEEVVVVAQVAEAEASALRMRGEGACVQVERGGKDSSAATGGGGGRSRKAKGDRPPPPPPPLLYEIFAHYLFCLPPLSPTYMTGG